MIKVLRRRAWATSALALLVLSPWLARSAPNPVAPDDSDPELFFVNYPRVRLVHARDPDLAGTTANLRARDPFLLYELGRNLTTRAFTREEGAQGRPGEPVHAADPTGRLLLLRDNASSCTFCHTQPNGELGSGQTIPSVGPKGRNTPHLFGMGLVEHIGQRILVEALKRADPDGDGIIRTSEARRAGRLWIRPMPGANPIDFGDFTPDDEGVPQLNSVFRVWYVDRAGEPLRDAASLNDPGVAGMRIAPQVFGWGHGYAPSHRHPSLGADASTLRRFTVVAADLHMGLQAFRSDRAAEPTYHGLAGTLSGALLADLDAPPDPGHRRTAFGWSMDDSDGDGVPSELTPGDLDAIEFFLLHYPAPVQVRSTAAEHGRAVFDGLGCARCHVPDWQIPAYEPALGVGGDRRLFRLEVQAKAVDAEPPTLEARLVRQYTRDGKDVRPRRLATRVEGIYSDFRQWDIGPAFWETRYNGSVQKHHRTAPLWGVGSSAPYGHAGDFLDLDSVIRAHAGQALDAAQAYHKLDGREREALIGFLQSLVLWDTDRTPADIDGDGAIAAEFSVGGEAVGVERFDARFLFATPPRFEVLQPRQIGGHSLPLMALEGIDKAFALDQPYRRDDDGDRFPDVSQHLASAAAPPPRPAAATPALLPVHDAGSQDVRGVVAAQTGRQSAMPLIERDPLLAYRLGQQLFARQWSSADGAYRALPVRTVAGATNSCALCHATPFGSAGFGVNTSDPLGAGRNAPHLFGAGLLESIGIRIQAEIMREFDLNRNGWIDVPSESNGRHVRIHPAPGVELELGSLEDFFRDGWPDLNDALMIRIVDASGQLLDVHPDGRPYTLLDPEAAGYTLAFGTFASTAGDHQFQSLRSFSVGAMMTVFGIPIDDATTGNDTGSRGDLHAGDGWAAPSALGAPQHYLSAAGLDAHQKAALVALRKDPGIRPVSTAELDLLEFYLLNHPPPIRTSPRGHKGEQLMRDFGCTRCHVEDWYLERGPERPGGQRPFGKRLASAVPASAAALRPVSFNGQAAGEKSSARKPRVVRGVYSDLLHHDLGEEFYEYSKPGGRLRVLHRSRTPPLWGVGSTAPYGRRGLSPTLDHVIRRHGGEAESSRDRYLAASDAEREMLLEFLGSLRLFDAGKIVQ